MGRKPKPEYGVSEHPLFALDASSKALSSVPDSHQQIAEAVKRAAECWTQFASAKGAVRWQDIAGSTTPEPEDCGDGVLLFRVRSASSASPDALLFLWIDQPGRIIWKVLVRSTRRGLAGMGQRQTALGLTKERIADLRRGSNVR